MGVKHPDVEKGLAELGKSNQGASLKYEEIQPEELGEVDLLRRLGRKAQ